MPLDLAALQAAMAAFNSAAISADTFTSLLGDQIIGLTPPVTMPDVIITNPATVEPVSASRATNLTASQSGAVVCLAWDNPNGGDFNHVEVLQSSVPNIHNAQVAHVTAASNYNALLPSSGIQHYWVRAVNITGARSAHSNMVTVAAPVQRTPHIAALMHVAFICDVCQKPAVNFQHYGGGHYMVRCHNQKDEVWGAFTRAEHSAHSPLVVHVFKDQTMPRSVGDGRPNVRFHCRNCDSISSEFDYQRDENKHEHVFVVRCTGKCDADRVIVRFTDEQLAGCDAWSTVTPVVLPMDGKLLGKKAAPRPPTAPFVVRKAVRKLRLE